MLRATFHTAVVQEFTREFTGEAHRRSLRKAARSEAFRLLRSLREHLRSGAGVTPRAQLTRRLARNRWRQALRAFANWTAYRVTETSHGVDILVGIAVPHPDAGKQAERARRQWLAEMAVKGARWAITREAQAAIAARIRKKGARPTVGRGRARRSIIPEVGHIVRLPPRPFTDTWLQKERGGRNTAENIQRLYEMAQRGERWARDWWKS